MKLRFKKVSKGVAALPAYKHEGDSGMDIRSNQYSLLLPGGVYKLHTGIAAEIPLGYEIQVRPRSGLTSKGIIGIIGTVDSNYRGEICVVLLNASEDPFAIEPGDRIAQLVLCKVAHAEIEECPEDEELSETVRGDAGFGSTGVK